MPRAAQSSPGQPRAKLAFPDAMPMPLTPSCISHLLIVLVVSLPICHHHLTLLFLLSVHALRPDRTSCIRVYVHTHVVYRCKVVIADNHLGIRLDSWVQRSLLSVL